MLARKGFSTPAYRQKAGESAGLPQRLKRAKRYHDHYLDMDLSWDLWEPILQRAERDLAEDVSNLDAVFHDLPLEMFGVLMLAVPDRYPRLKRLLPHMPDEATQRAWTGDAGLPLLWKGTNFVRTSLKYFRYNDCRSQGLTALDFGCGWGRLLRLYYKYFPIAQIEAVDPWDKSLEECRASGFKSHVAQSDYLPESLPTKHDTFDFIYSFSVFTHLSPRAFRTCLTTLRRYLSEDGLLVITIRPVEYWLETGKPESVAKHLEDGYFYEPHPSPAVDGESVYGDITVSLNYLKQFDQWRIEDVEVNYTDPLQVFVALRPNN
jgi:hypothetical protein